MSKRKRILALLAEGGRSQAEVTALAGTSKRDVSACAAALRDGRVDPGMLPSLTEAQVDEAIRGPGEEAEPVRLPVDVAALAERKRRNPRLPARQMWAEHREASAAAGRLPYSYSQFCEIFAAGARRLGVSARFVHVPGEKCYVD